MDSLSVHIAVLTIANDPASADRATAQVIIERARASGHEIVDEETVKDTEGAIRDQLVRWIAQPEIDVVIVAAGMDSDAASSALAPLIMQTIPGFTDLFRWLTFQEIGASAMLSAAEAAQCESTFVFVLPAHAAAARAAMDKLILPQLDVNTKPKNLVAQMPRLAEAAKHRADTAPSETLTIPAAAHHAVPVPIVAEKTSGGSGLPPKLPARTRQPTANIIARKPADPPTKQIDLARLEKQLELSNVNEAQTKQLQVGPHDAKTKVVDMSAHQAKTRVVDGNRVLPRVPPGADDSAFGEDESLTFAEPPAAMAKRIPSLTGKGSPLKTPPFATPIARSPGDRHTAPTPPAATPHLRPPSDRHTAATPPAATPHLRPPSRESSDRHTATTPPAATPHLRPPSRDPSDRHTSATPHASTPQPDRADRHTATTPPGATATATPPGARASATPPSTPVRSPQPTPPPAPVRSRPPTPPPPPAAKRAPTEPPPPPAAKRAPTEPPPAPAAKRAPTEPPPVPDDKRPAPNAAELWSRAFETSVESSTSEVATTVRGEDVSTREPDAPLDRGDANETTHASAEARPATSAALAGSPARARKPTPPPLPAGDPLAAVTSRPIGGGELPQGDFVYPIKRSGGALLLKLLAAVAVAGLGFFAFVKLYPSDGHPTQTAAVAAPAVEPGGSAAIEPPPGSTDSANGSAPGEPSANGSAATAEQGEPEIEPEIEMDTPDPRDAHATTGTSHSRPPGRRGGSHAASTSNKPDESASKPPRDDSGASAETAANAKPGDDSAGDETPPADPGCDEVSCVLSKYDRPCCERFKPTETFTPRNVVPDALDRAMVKAGVEKIKPRIVACGEKHHASGTVKLAVTVDGSGKVKSASVTESPDPALGTCVQAAMLDATFGKSVNGGDFAYPFVF